MQNLRLLTAAFCFLAVCAPAHAQYYDSREDLMDRLDRLEHDQQIMQRQVARGEPVTMNSNDASAPAGSPNAMVRITQLEEELRNTQGEIEKLQHRNDELKEQLVRMSRDMEFRIKAVEDRQGGAALPPAASSASAPPAPSASYAPTPAAPAPDEYALADKMDRAAPAEPKPVAATGTANDQYNAAFKLLNETQYEQAGTAFEEFVRKYPSDPLTANAYYWLGETYYVRSNYTKAADSFRQGFETAPKGQKAADNLLKLGMSLSAMKRDKEACVVFKQTSVKYTGSGASRKASQEYIRMNCQ